MIAWWSFRSVRSASFPTWHSKAPGWRESTRQRCCGQTAGGARRARTSARHCGGCAGRLAMALSGLNRAGLALANTVAVDVQDVAKEARALISAPVNHDAELPAVNAETVSRLSTCLLPGWYRRLGRLEQERWDQLRLHALEAAAEVLLCRGQHMLALEAGLVAARSELFRESAHRVIIRVYLAEGNVGAAMQHYRDYQRKLRRELNLAPTTAMDELIHPLIAPHTPS